MVLDTALRRGFDLEFGKTNLGFEGSIETLFQSLPSQKLKWIHELFFFPTQI